MPSTEDAANYRKMDRDKSGVSVIIACVANDNMRDMIWPIARVFQIDGK